MDNLTEEQKASFAANNALVGLGPNEFTVQLSDEEFAVLPTTRIMSSDPDESHFPPHFIEVGSIAEMRKIAGFPEQFVETGNDEPHYPPPPTTEDIELVTKDSTNLKFLVSNDLQKRIEQAAQAFVLGNPEKVKAYEPLINAALFPGKAAVFTGGTLQIPAGSHQMIKGDIPVFLNFETIIVGENATISAHSTFALNSQRVIQESLKGESGLEATNGNYTYKFIGEPFTEPATIGTIGPSGASGPQGTAGVGGYNGGNCQHYCVTEPGPGQPGLAPDSPGNLGAPGAQGRPSPAGVHRLGLVTGQVTILLGGSDGQQGGKGGPGGGGGPGGPPGNAAQGCQNTAGNGPQGPGGKGGTGGPGGPGGLSGFVSIYYSDGGGKVSVSVTGCAGGKGGDPGDAGVGVGNLGGGTQGTTGKPPGPTPQFSLNKT